MCGSAAARGAGMYAVPTNHAERWSMDCRQRCHFAVRAASCIVVCFRFQKFRDVMVHCSELAGTDSCKVRGRCAPGILFISCSPARTCAMQQGYQNIFDESRIKLVDLVLKAHMRDRICTCFWRGDTRLCGSTWRGNVQSAT